jgi:rhodanese-related sulfurtransferase
MRQGAQIIDVRTPAEFRGGHIKGSLNFPLNDLQKSMRKIPKDKPVITCCRSGARSESAKRMLLSNGYSDVHNGGGWAELKRNIDSAKKLNV